MNQKIEAMQLDVAGCCIICREPKPERRRGLCVKHYQQLRAAMFGLSEQEAAEFEQIAIENGQLMPSNQGKRPGVDNVFADLAAAIRLKHAHAAEDREHYDLPADEAEIIADAKRAGGVRKTRTKKKKAE